MKSKLIFLTIALIVAAAFAGCGSNQPIDTDVNQNPIATDAEKVYTELITEPMTNEDTLAEDIITTSVALETTAEDVPATTTSDVKPTESSTEVKYNEPQINFSDLE